jgi:hypothetical protein
LVGVGPSRLGAAPATEISRCEIWRCAYLAAGITVLPEEFFVPPHTAAFGVSGVWEDRDRPV